MSPVASPRTTARPLLTCWLARCTIPWPTAGRPSPPCRCRTSGQEVPSWRGSFTCSVATARRITATRRWSTVTILPHRAGRTQATRPARTTTYERLCCLCRHIYVCKSLAKAVFLGSRGSHHREHKRRNHTEKATMEAVIEDRGAPVHLREAGQTTSHR